MCHLIDINLQSVFSIIWQKKKSTKRFFRNDKTHCSILTLEWTKISKNQIHKRHLEFFAKCKKTLKLAILNDICYVWCYWQYYVELLYGIGIIIIIKILLL